MATNSCFICGHASTLQFPAKDYITGDSFEIYRCSGCKTATTSPAPFGAEAGKYYQKIYGGNKKSILKSMMNDDRARNINRLAPKDGSGSILEIGCGNGLLLCLLKKQGWHVAGNEIAPAEYIHPEVRDDVVRKPIDESGFKDASFDVVTMWHFLEHVNDPLYYLSTAYRLLKPNGKVLLEVPNVLSLQARLTKANWVHLEVPRHLVHFSSEGLTKLLEKAGFVDAKISYTNVILVSSGFYQSLLNFLSKRKNFIFDIANGRAGVDIIKDNKSDTAVALVATIPLLALSAIGLLSETLFHKSGIMRVTATKPPA